jgi:hypothetical protein
MPDVVIVNACELPCPAIRPTMSSPGAVGVTWPDADAVLVFGAPVTVSSGLVVAMR